MFVYFFLNFLKNKRVWKQEPVGKKKSGLLGLLTLKAFKFPISSTQRSVSLFSNLGWQFESVPGKIFQIKIDRIVNQSQS